MPVQLFGPCIYPSTYQKDGILNTAQARSPPLWVISTKYKNKRKEFIFMLEKQLHIITIVNWWHTACRRYDCRGQLSCLADESVRLNLTWRQRAKPRWVHALNDSRSQISLNSSYSCRIGEIYGKIVIYMSSKTAINNVTISWEITFALYLNSQFSIS